MKKYFIHFLLILLLYNPWILRLFGNTYIIIVTLGIQIYILGVSFSFFTLGCVYNGIFMLYFPFLLYYKVISITPNTTLFILLLIIMVFAISIINLILLAADIRDKKPLTGKSFQIKKLNVVNRRFLSFIVAINKKQIVMKIIMIFMLYLLLLFNLLFVFAILYANIGHLFNEGINCFNNILDAVYFSATTFFTIGFGDITPYDYSQLTKVIVVVQAILGHLITTVFWPIVIIFAFNKRSIQ